MKFVMMLENRLSEGMWLTVAAPMEQWHNTRKRNRELAEAHYDYDQAKKPSKVIMVCEENNKCCHLCRCELTEFTRDAVESPVDRPLHALVRLSYRKSSQEESLIVSCGRDFYPL